LSQSEPLRIHKQAIAIELALAGVPPRTVEVFLAEHRAHEFRRQHVLDLIEHADAFLPARDPSTGKGELINKDSVLWIGVPLAPLGLVGPEADDELFEFRRPVQVEFVGGDPLLGELLYSARQESSRLMDYLNEAGRFFSLWANERLYLINKTLVRRVVDAPQG
jgi:hypothetical protein